MTTWSAGGPVAGAGADLRAPRGTALSCKGWEQEGALRMLMNCVDPEVAELRQEQAQGGIVGAAQRGSAGFRATLDALRCLDGDETLLVRSGAPAGVFRMRTEAPRVVIENEELRNCGEAADASWLFVGTQTYLPVLFEALAVAARKHFGGTFAGRLVVTCGMGESGGALSLAATLNGAAFLGIDPDAERIKRRVKTGYCEAMVNDLDEALRILKNSVRKREAASVGLIGDCAAVTSELAQRGIVPDLLVDCVSAGGIDDGEAEAERIRRLRELRQLGSLVYRFGGESVASGRGDERPDGSAISDFAAEYARPLFTGARTPLLWAALSGEPADIARADRLALDLFSGDDAAVRWIRLAGKHVQFQGLPARVCLVDRSLRAEFATALNRLVALGEIKAPVVIGCADFACATEAPATIAADAASTETLLAGLGAAARAASWVAIRGADCGSSDDRWVPVIAVVADGTTEMARRVEVVFGGGRGDRDVASPRG